MHPFFLPLFARLILLSLAFAISMPIEAYSSEALPDQLLVSQRPSSSVQGLLDQAAVKANSQDYATAVSLLTQALNLSSSLQLSNQILLDRAKIYLILAQPRLALGDLAGIKYPSSQFSELANLWLLRGSANILNKDYSAAASDLTTALRFEPNNPMILANRAVAYRALGKLELAKQDIQFAIKIQPNKINYYNLAVLMYQLRDFRSCNLLISDLLKSSSPYTPLYYQRGLCLLSMGAFEAAAADMLKVLAIDPEHADALEQLGILMARQRRPDAAMQYLSRSSSIRLSRGDIDGYNRVLTLIKKLSDG
jgi:tetratricopeptide (TPR) repeat protein